jgi:hypothetical protein
VRHPLDGILIYDIQVIPLLSKVRFELTPSEEERHLKPPPWTARPSRQWFGVWHTGGKETEQDYIEEAKSGARRGGAIKILVGDGSGFNLPMQVS